MLRNICEDQYSQLYAKKAQEHFKKNNIYFSASHCFLFFFFQILANINFYSI